MTQIAAPSSQSKHGKTRTESLPRKYSSMCWACSDGESACNSRSGGLCESQYPACGPSSRSLCIAEPAPGFRGRPGCRAPNPSCKPTRVSIRLAGREVGRVFSPHYAPCFRGSPSATKFLWKLSLTEMARGFAPRGRDRRSVEIVSRKNVANEP